MRVVQRTTQLLLVVLAVLMSDSVGQRRRQQSGTAVSADWRQPVSAAPPARTSRSLRDTLLEVREQLRAPHITRSQRRQLKTRKRRLREALRMQRAQRRRERRQRRRQRARTRPHHSTGWAAVTAPELPPEPTDAGHPESGSGHTEQPGYLPPDTDQDYFTDEDETATGAGDDDREDEQLLSGGGGGSVDHLGGGVGRSGDGRTADEHGQTGDDEQLLVEREELLGGQTPAGDGEVKLAEHSHDAANADDRPPNAAAAVSVESDEDASADSGGFLRSFWDLMSPITGTEPEQEPELEQELIQEQEPTQEQEQEQEKDAGWTVPPLPAGRRPNIVLIMTDDLDVELGSLNYMPKLRRFLQDEGVTFRHGYVSTPLCCPSRSSYLTGMFVHNHQVYTNRDNCSSLLWQQTHERRTYAAYLQQAGYRTGHFGKYMNRYEGEHIPAGWHHWSSLILNSKYYNYSMNVNGRRREHGWRYPMDYLPSVVVNESLTFFERTRREHADSPVLMVLSFPGPHGPEDAAPQHTGLFLNATDHHTPAYDFAPSADKQWFLRHVGKMEAVERTFTDLLMTKRLQTLQSVDDGIEQVYHTLAAAGELDNTYIVFTSDHGYHLGQFGLAKGKSYPFEFDIRVPFVVRGPGVRAGSRSRDAVLNVDLAPTLLEMGGVTPPAHMDGRSFLALLAATDRPAAAAPPWPDTFIVEGAGRRPDQRVRRRLQQGAVRADDKNVLYVSALQRLQEVCSEPRYSSPCGPTQRWACYHDGRRWRLQKCRRRHRAPQMCACRGGVVQGTRRMRASERHDQLRFLQEHLQGDVRHVRFVKELRRRRQRRQRRAAAATATDSQLVKQFVVEQDASYVDDGILRIGSELQILQSHVRSVGRCAVDNTTCVTPDRYSRRLLVNDQIRRLKQLLKQLKSIRRHLHLTDVSPRPGRTGLGSGRQGVGRSGGTFEEGDFADYSDGEDGDLVAAGDSTRRPGGRYKARKTVAEEDGSTDVAFCPCRPLDDRAERQWVREYTKHARREEKAQRRRERRRQKRRKQRKKERLASQNCNFEGLNCFVHDNDHWKTPPLWTHGPVCICLGASNGTFDCLRGVGGGGGTDNWLYCRFITGFLSFYDLTVDPYQLHNLAPTLDGGRLQQLDAQLAEMQACRGPDQCRPLPGRVPTAPPPPPPSAASPTPWQLPPVSTQSSPAPPTAELAVSSGPRRQQTDLERGTLGRHSRRRRQRASATFEPWVGFVSL